MEGFLMNKKDVVYMVEYYDNRNRKHMAWVKGFFGVRLLEDRYHVISWEVTECYSRINIE